MKSRSILIKVPATVGNFAGAMNCAALTLDAMVNVKVTPRTDGRVGFRYFGENGNRIPRDRSNLVVRAMEEALHLKGLEFTGADFEVYSSVPVAVGLGASAAAVLAGLIAADRLYSLGLDEKTLFDLARIYETRLDNLHAAWHGGFVACAGEQPSRVLRRTFVPGDFVLSVVTPESEAGCAVREPAELMGRDQAVNLERAQVLADLFARPGRRGVACLEPVLPPAVRTIVPGLEEALKISADGVLGVFVCGAGPAVGILSYGNPEEAIAAVRRCFLDFGIPSSFGLFRPANVGALELNAVTPQITFPALRLTETPARGPVSYNAVERLLDKPFDELMQIAKDTLEGNLRGVLATLTPEEVNEDRLKFAQRLIEEADEDLQKLGLELDTLKIQNVTDEVKYLDSIGRQKTAEVQKTARVAEAQRSSEAEQTEAAARQAAQVAGIQADLKVTEENNRLRVRKAELEAEALAREAEAKVAGDRARVVAEQGLQQERITLQQKQLEADVLLPAQAEREAAEQRAKGVAASITEDGRSRLFVLEQMIKLYQAAGTEAERIFVLNMLPEIIRELAKPVGEMAIDKMTVIDSGGRGTGVASVASQLPEAIIKLTEQVETATGINILSRLGRSIEGSDRKPAKS